MTASEDPAAQPGSEAAGPDQSRDDLEHWLSDLRTDVAADPPGWINKDAVDERPADEEVEHIPTPPTERSPVPPTERGTTVSEPSSGGRHRAPD